MCRQREARFLQEIPCQRPLELQHTCQNNDKNEQIRVINPQNDNLPASVGISTTCLLPFVCFFLVGMVGLLALVCLDGLVGSSVGCFGSLFGSDCTCALMQASSNSSGIASVANMSSIAFCKSFGSLLQALSFVIKFLHCFLQFCGVLPSLSPKSRGFLLQALLTMQLDWVELDTQPRL